MSGLGKLVRGLIGLVIVGAIILTINSWYHDYRNARPRSTSASKATSATVDATQSVVPVQGQHAVILASGLELNSSAATGTKSIRALKKGESLILVGVTSNNWLQLRDTTGKFGYVANNSANVKVQK